MLQDIIAVGAYSFFELAGVAGSLGLLIAGIILSGRPVSERLSRRSSAFANYSEFGLIVISVAVSNGVLPKSWTSIMAITVAGSFVLSSIFMAKEEKVLRTVLRWIPESPERRLALMNGR